MDVVWLTLNNDPKVDTKSLAQAAMKAFHNTWIENGMTSAEDMIGWDKEEVKLKYKFRTPMNAMEMLWAYIDQRRDFIIQCELMEVEKPFAVPLHPTNADLLYVGRLDKVVLTPRKKIAAVEHKTTSLGSKNGIQSNHLESYNPNSQVDGYLHALRMDYGEKATSAFIDIALVNAYTQEVFQLWPVSRAPNLLNGWLYEVFYYIERIRDNKLMLLEYRSDGSPGDVMPCYPKDTSRCFDFFSKCEYHDLCVSWANPDEHDIPEGFKEEHWSPFDVLGLDKLGMEDEDG
tara:strand:+ start:506 stop:1369 length:864 start_codon:yes stop_codon:yes gene_type:complete